MVSSLATSQPLGPVYLKKYETTSRNIGFGCENCEKEETTQEAKEEKQQDVLDVPKTQSSEKFSIRNALKKYYEGFVSPVQAILNDPVVFAATGTIGIGISKLIEKNKKFAIPVITLMSGIGLYNFGSGVKKFIENKNNSKAREESFYDMGKGTAIIGISALPAPEVLRNSGINASNNIIKSLITCWKETPGILLGNKFAAGSSGVGAVAATTAVSTTDIPGKEQLPITTNNNKMPNKSLLSMITDKLTENLGSSATAVTSQLPDGIKGKMNQTLNILAEK